MISLSPTVCDLLESFTIILMPRAEFRRRAFQCALRLHSKNLDIPGNAGGVHAILSCLSFVSFLPFSLSVNKILVEF